MRHPTEGVLRRLLDEPAGVADPDRQHVAGCPRCLAGLADAQADAALVGAALRTTEGGSDADAAWRRLSAAAPSRAGAWSAAPARSARVRALVRRPVVAVAAVGVVLAGAGTAAANDWLPIFSTQQIAPVSISTADLVSLPDLSAYGTLAVDGKPDVHQVRDAATAAADTGLAVPEVSDLPRGVTGRPVYQEGGQISATFTFSTDRAVTAAAEPGSSVPPPPPGLDGSKVRLVAGPGVAEVWSQGGGVPTLVVGRAVAPTAYSSGVPFATMRDYLLSLPGLPADLAAQLRAFSADGATLPLPVPADQVTTSTAQVHGVPATVLSTRDRTMAGVVWVENGQVTAVAGSLDTDELLSIARGLR